MPDETTANLIKRGAVGLTVLLCSSQTMADPAWSDVPHYGLQFNRALRAYCGTPNYYTAECQRHQQQAWACLHLAEIAGPTYSLARGKMSIGASAEAAASRVAGTTHAPLSVAKYAAGLVAGGRRKTARNFAEYVANDIQQHCYAALPRGRSTMTNGQRAGSSIKKDANLHLDLRPMEERFLL